MAKKRIMEFPGSIQGGVGSVVMNLFRNIDKQRVQIDFCVLTEKEGKFDTEIQQNGGNIYHIPKIRRVGIRRYVKSIEKVLLQNGPYDGIHVHSVHMGVFALIAAKKVGVPLRIFHVHNTKDAALEKIPCHTFIEKILDNLIIKYSTIRLACGREAGMYIYGDKVEFDVINNAVQIDRFYPYDMDERMNIRNDLGFSEADVVIGNVARFCEEKNQEFIVYLVAADRLKGGNIKAIFVGEGPLLDKVKRKAVALNCEECIKFLGNRVDVERLYNAMDVFCLPSLFEGLPVTVIEAQACGVPCITSTLVTSESNLGITPYKRIGLDEDAELWVETIYECAKQQKISSDKIKEMLIKKEYEVATVVNKVAKIYMV